jgi:hypothetical protein
VVSLENVHGVNERMKVDDNIQGVHDTLEGVQDGTRDVDSVKDSIKETRTTVIDGAEVIPNHSPDNVEHLTCIGDEKIIRPLASDICKLTRA